MNWYKKAQTLQGEWWIADGQVLYADGDIGDMNHEAYVIDSIKRKYAYDEFTNNEWIDWDEFKIALAKEQYEEKYEQNQQNQHIMDFETLKKNFPEKIEDMYLAKLKELGMTNEEYRLAEGFGDAREYGLKHLGWKRVKQNNVQTQTLTQDDLKDIANGLWEAYDEECQKETFNIEVNSTRTIYNDVPYQLISDGAPSALMEYRSNY